MNTSTRRWVVFSTTVFLLQGLLGIYLITTDPLWQRVLGAFTLVWVTLMLVSLLWIDR